jgi:hypothetical protein
MAGALVLVGCSSPGVSLEGRPEAVSVRVDEPLHDPVWSYRSNELIAPTDGHRLAAVGNADDPDTVHTRLSEPLAIGRNLQISQADDRNVFVPQPEQNRVAVVSLADLVPIGTLDAGPAPAYLSEDAGMRVLLALSADGSTVTPVDQYGLRKLPSAKLTGGAATIIDGANRGRAIEYHLYGSSGILYYKGPSSPPEKRGTFGMNIVAAAGDGAKVTRSYVADVNRDVLYAVDSGRDQHGLREVGRAEVSSPIRYLGTDDTRIYAATDQNVMVFETASFIGYPDGAIPLLRAIDYRAALPSGPARTAALSGMAIGPSRVYLTLQGQPVVVSVAKPRL